MLGPLYELFCWARLRRRRCDLATGDNCVEKPRPARVRALDVANLTIENAERERLQLQFLATISWRRRILLPNHMQGSNRCVVGVVWVEDA